MARNSIKDFINFKTKKKLIKKQLETIHDDLLEISIDPETNRSILTFDNESQMVRAEFQSDSETFRLMKLFEKLHE